MQQNSLTFQSDSLSQPIQIDPLLLQQLQCNGFLLQDNLDESMALIHLDMEPTDLDTTNITYTSSLGISNETGDLQFYPENPSDNTNPLNELASRAKEFQCDVCQKKYSSKAILKKHVKVHGSDEFRCKKCNKGFKSRGDMEKHVRLHYGYRPFSCRLCTNSFGGEAGLKTHMRRFVKILSTRYRLR